MPKFEQYYLKNYTTLNVQIEQHKFNSLIDAGYNSNKPSALCTQLQIPKSHVLCICFVEMCIRDSSNSVVLLHYIGSNHQLLSSLISSILLVSKMKLLSLSTTDLLSPKRTSVDQSSNGRTIAPSPRSSVSGSSFSFSSGADINAIPLPELIKIFSARVLFYYDQSTNDFENMVPDLVYVESILRTIKFMIGIYLGGNDLSSLLLQSIVFCKSYSNTIVNSQFFLKSDILKEIDKVFQLQLVDMGIIEQCRIYSTLASMYGDLDLCLLYTSRCV